MEIRKYYIKLILLVAVVSIALNACKKDTGDIDIANRPVVIAYLIAGEAVSIRVYEQKGLLDTASYGPVIEGLKITFSNGSKSVVLTESAAGKYTSTDLSLVTENASCSMKFNYNDKTISASTKVPSAPLNFTSSATEQAVPDPSPDSSAVIFHPVAFNWTAVAGENYLLVFQNQESTPNRIGSGFGMRRGYEPIEEYLGESSSFITQRMTFDFSGYYDVYLYHINKEYNEILNSSGSSSLNLTNPATNVLNGLGIFTAMSRSHILFHVYKQ